MKSPKKALVLGAETGLLGQSLTTAITNTTDWQVTAAGRSHCDVTDCMALEKFIANSKPDLIFNTVAYTAVDLAEDHANEANALNKTLPICLARISQRLGIHLFHYSTDYVFNGKHNKAYTETDATDPLNVYGASKLAGEKELLANFADCTTIIRSAWLFGPYKRNFITTILDLCKKNNAINIVFDQVGSPTYTPDLAKASIILAEKEAIGLFHVANTGQASWCELATEALEIAAPATCTITPIPSADYPQKAVRPAFSPLDTSKYTSIAGEALRPWPQALREYIFQAIIPD